MSKHSMLDELNARLNEFRENNKKADESLAAEKARLVSDIQGIHDGFILGGKMAHSMARTENEYDEAERYFDEAEKIRVNLLEPEPAV